MWKHLLKALVAAAAVVGLVIPGAAVTVAGTEPPPVIQIVGGRNATQTYPFMVSLQSGDQHSCGGVLIRPDWVLTALHCIVKASPAQLRARVGSINHNSGGTVVKVKRLVVHPDAAPFDPVGPHDVGLVQLAAPVAQPPIQIMKRVPIGSKIRILGWGNTSASGESYPVTLKQLDTSVLPDDRCKVPRSAVLCVNSPDGRRGACNGDSGGPAIARLGGAWQLAGTTSGFKVVGAECGTEPTIYVDSAAVRPWIDSVLTGRFLSNMTRVNIRDLRTAKSAIKVTGIAGNAPAKLKVSVFILHDQPGDLVLRLVAPGGRSYLLQHLPDSDRSLFQKTYTVNTSGQKAEGVWQLRVQDTVRGNSGQIFYWSLRF